MYVWPRLVLCRKYIHYHNFVHLLVSAQFCYIIAYNRLKLILVITSRHGLVENVSFIIAVSSRCLGKILVCENKLSSQYHQNTHNTLL
jgi:hypothetical protein